LTAACGVIFGLIAPLVQDANSEPGKLFVAAIVGGLVLAFIGAMLGLLHHNRLRGALWGVCVGGGLGLLYGPLMFVPPEYFPFVLSTAFGGAVVIVALAVVIRSNSAQSPTGRSRNEAEIESVRRHPLDPDV
jgi:hypothetical protein